MRSVFAALFLVSLEAWAQTPGAASAQQGTPDRQVEESPAADPGKSSFLKTFAADEWRMWTAPFRRSSYSAASVKRYVIPFTLIAGTLIATDRRTSEALPNTKDQTVWSGRVSQIGAAYTLAAGSGAISLVGRLAGDRRATETGWLGLQAIAHAQIIVVGLKQMSNRERPLQNEGGVGFWHGGDSFPSGHATTSFAVAAVFAHEYSDHLAVPIAAYSVAGLVSLSRVSARRHWLSDIFVGGSTGFLIGRYVYKQHHDPNLRGRNRGRISRLIPEIGIGPSGPALIWRP